MTSTASITVTLATLFSLFAAGCGDKTDNTLSPNQGSANPKASRLLSYTSLSNNPYNNYGGFHNEVLEHFESRGYLSTNPHLDTTAARITSFYLSYDGSDAWDTSDSNDVVIGAKWCHRYVDSVLQVNSIDQGIDNCVSSAVARLYLHRLVNAVTSDCFLDTTQALTNQVLTDGGLDSLQKHKVLFVIAIGHYSWQYWNQFASSSIERNVGGVARPNEAGNKVVKADIEGAMWGANISATAQGIGGLVVGFVIAGPPGALAAGMQGFAQGFISGAITGAITGSIGEGSAPNGNDGSNTGGGSGTGGTGSGGQGGQGKAGRGK